MGRIMALGKSEKKKRNAKMKSHYLKITVTFVYSNLTLLVSLKYFYLKQRADSKLK